MKSGMPWSLREVDEETREAIYKAAQRAGLTVSEWLSSTAGEDTPGGGAETDDDHPSVIAAALDRLTARLRSMDERSRATVPNLIKRLDEIEQRLARQAEGGRADGSLKGVSAMVEKLARDIEDADERARTMIEGQRSAGSAAPAANVTRVAEAIRDLDQRIARMGERIAPRREAPPPALDDIGSRLSALLAEQPRTQATSASERAAAIDAALRGLETRIDEAKARLIQPREPVQPPEPIQPVEAVRPPEPALPPEAPAAAPAAPPAADAEQIARIEQRLSEISDRLAERDQPAAQPAPAAEPEPTGKGNDLASAIAEISAHQRMLDDRAETLAMRRDQKALSAAMAALRTDLSTLSEQVTALTRSDAVDTSATFDLARRIEALSAERPIDRSLLTAIREDLAALRGVVEQNAVAPSLEQIEARSQAISTRLEDIVHETLDSSRLDALGEEVSALRRALESDDSPHAIQQLEIRVAELGRVMEAVLAGQQDSSVGAAVERLERRMEVLGEELKASVADRGARATDRAIERLEGQLNVLGEELKVALANRNAAVASQDAVERLEQRLDALSRNIVATLSERSAPTVVGRLDEIAARIDDLLDRSPAVASIASMQARLQSLIESVEGLSASQHEPTTALDEIKSGIAAIRSEIAGRGAADTDQLERQIRELAARLETATSSDAGSAGLAELEAQVAKLAGQLEDDEPRAAELRQVEESLEKLQSRLSESHRESIEAARSEARAAVNELSASLDDRGINADLIRALRQDLENLRAATEDHAAHSGADTEAVDQTLTQVVDRLDRLEQMTTAEDIATGTHDADVALPPAPLPATGAAPEVVPPQTAITGDRRADFIAAARRAAQAAAAEAHRGDQQPAEGSGDEAERKGGAFARISQAIRNRKRPLLLAAAAIVLAIGALKVYGTVNVGAPQQQAAVEPPTVSADAPKSASPDILAATGAAAPAAGGNAPAMVAPSTTPDPKIAFSAPSGVDSQFGAGNTAPPASGFTQQQSTATTEAPADAAAPADQATAPVALASASASAAPAPDSAIGAPKLVKAAASGNPAAAFEVASRYAAGSHVSRDLAKAADWYQRAAQDGVAVAQYRLGSLYERGQGVTKNLVKAVDWYQRAADQGNVNAMHNLAVLMSEGVGGPPDLSKALQWFKAAANYGVRDSQYNLGVIYARGLGTPQDLVASYKWFAIAAAQGDSDAAQRRDEVAKLLSAGNLAKARAAMQAWHAKPPLADANSVAVPPGGWDSPGNTLNDVDRAALVKKIQTLLAQQGFDPGPADGVAGVRTRDAVKAYQRENGIAQTGKIDGSLVAALTDQHI